MDQSISIEMDIKGGVISTCSIGGSTGWEKTAGNLEGKKHLYSVISDIIQADHPGITGDIIYNFFY